MKYVFLFLLDILKVLFYPVVLLNNWFCIYGDQAWCIFWHAGHYWIDQYEILDGPKPGRVWGKKCHRCNKLVKSPGYVVTWR